MARMGVDAIATNRPRILHNVLETLDGSTGPRADLPSARLD